jgi:hypothetical protein
MCLIWTILPFFLKRLVKFFSDMEKSANPHMKHTFFKWFLHNRKNDIMRFQKKGSISWSKPTKIARIGQQSVQIY